MAIWDRILLLQTAFRLDRNAFGSCFGMHRLPGR